MRPSRRRDFLGSRFTSLNKETQISRPWAQTLARDHIVFDRDLDVVARTAVRDTVRPIERLSGLAAEDADTLCSIVGDVHVTQFVNIDKGAHMMLAKSTLWRS